MHPRPERLTLFADEMLDRRAPLEPIHLRPAQAVDAGLVERHGHDAPPAGFVEDGCLAVLDHADQRVALLVGSEESTSTGRRSVICQAFVLQ